MTLPFQKSLKNKPRANDGTGLFGGFLVAF